MNEHTIALVLGAGSNCELGFPSGTGLTQYIVDSLHEHKVSDALHYHLRHKFSDATIKNFREELIKSGCRSVDRFLQYRPEFAEIGKHAIAIAILRFEHESIAGGFAADEMPKIYRSSESWYSYLLDRIVEEPDALRRINLKIVTFNYDRSLEFSLITGLMSRLKLSELQALERIKPLGITHVYGSVGDLSHTGPAEEFIPYGKGFDARIDHSYAANRIRVVDGREDDSAEFKSARADLESADTIAFLGFGFDPVNVRRLLSYGGARPQHFCGTAHLLKDREKLIAQLLVSEQILVRSGGLTNVPGESTVIEFLRTTGLLDRNVYSPVSMNGQTVTLPI